jgi:hypothetical protein
MRIVIIISALMLMNASCKKEGDYKNFMEETLEEKFGSSLNNYKSILIVPSVGCSGCISDTEHFIKQNINSLSNVKVIFTKINSKKILKHNIGDSIYYNKKVFVDSNNIFAYNTGKTIYPALVYLSKGEIDKIEYKNPDNPDILNTLINE